MRLLTDSLLKQAQHQFNLGAEFENQIIVAKFFDPCGSFTWYLMNIDPDDNDYCWGIVKGGYELECGSFSLSELESIKTLLGLEIERDLHFKQIPAKKAWDILKAGEHI